MFCPDWPVGMEFTSFIRQRVGIGGSMTDLVTGKQGGGGWGTCKSCLSHMGKDGSLQ